MTRPVRLIEGPYKELFAFDGDHSLLHFKDLEPCGDDVVILHNAARACNIISAYFFNKLKDPLTWPHIASSPALQPVRSDWLARRWDHLVFSHILSEHGAPTHYIDLVELEGHSIDFHDAARQPSFLKVLRFSDIKTTEHVLAGQDVCYYPPNFGEKEPRLIPLKVRYYHRLEPGSQLVQRLHNDPTEAASLGLTAIPTPGELFQRPVLEFYTKAEPVERLLNLQEALLISGLTPGQFDEMVEFAYCISLALLALLQEKKLGLDCGLLEFGSTSDGIILVDTLSPLDMQIVDKQPLLPMLQSCLQAERSDELWGILCNQILGQHVFFDCPERL